MGFFSKLKEKFKREKEQEIYDSSLKESREHFTRRFTKLEKKYKKVDSSYFDEVEEILISSDCGVTYTLNILEELLKKVKDERLEDTKDINEALFELMFSKYLDQEESLKKGIEFLSHPEVILISGVNGVGKTTTIAKLTNFYQKEGKKVLVIEGDTFRAGAKEQMIYWSQKLNCDLVYGKDNEDPSSVIFQGLEKAKSNDYDLVIIDTAGRLQNKINLMNELKKISRVIEKEGFKIDECFLVLDATNGQNGILQAKAFKEILPLSGVILTKMDGTSKGGIILSIKNELDLPVRFIGLGEKMDDLEIFDLSKYLIGLLGLSSEEEDD